jgi:hypothetical protein
LYPIQKRQSRHLGKAALMGMLSKHLISVLDMCMDKQQYSKEQWDEKITDSINYFLILREIVAFGSTGR